MCVGARLCNLSGQRVEAQQVAQHPQKAPVEQVAALGKHGGQAGAAPLQRLAFAQCARHLHRKRHVRLGRGHAQARKQRDQIGIGALVVNQKPGVHTVGDPVQRDIDRVGMTAKIIRCFKQGDVGPASERVGH